ncbi:MAG: VOC family protein [Armatimonadetes bacterium]|nr:VOC family protein [Armatimonadota bacterium]
MHTICHIEFNVSDLARSQAFFHGLFPNWEFRSFIEGMVVFGIGDQHIGGLMKSDNIVAGNSPSVWFQVEDIDATITRAASLGGSAQDPKQPVPGVGWSATVHDPDGNNVGLVQFASQDS